MPPFVAVAVNVTDVPAQIVDEPVVMAMLTEGVRFGFTVIVIELLIGLLEARQVALLASTTVMISPLANVVDVNVLLFVPVFTPFTFH